MTDQTLREQLAGLREALESAATHLEAQTLEHSPDCSYGATDGPHGDFCDCGLSARRQKRNKVYAEIQAALAAHPAGVEPGFDSEHMARIIAAHLSLGEQDIALLKGYLHRAFVAGTEAKQVYLDSHLKAANGDSATRSPAESGLPPDGIVHSTAEYVGKSTQIPAPPQPEGERVRAYQRGVQDAVDILLAYKLHIGPKTVTDADVINGYLDDIAKDILAHLESAQAYAALAATPTPARPGDTNRKTVWLVELFSPKNKSEGWWRQPSKEQGGWRTDNAWAAKEYTESEAKAVASALDYFPTPFKWSIG